MNRVATQEALVQLLRGLGLRKPRPRVESFTSVASQIQLIRALFANVDRQGGQGSELLLWSVNQILAGQLVLQGYKADFHCWYTYRGAGVERTVKVSSTSLTEYSTRSLMSLEGLKDQPDKVGLLQTFLEQVRAIIANDTGLVATAAAHYKIGHPKFRQDVTISLGSSLASAAQSQLLDRCGKDFFDYRETLSQNQLPTTFLILEKMLGCRAWELGSRRSFTLWKPHRCWAWCRRARCMPGLPRRTEKASQVTC